MAYGSVNVPGVSYTEFDALRKSVNDMENTINMVPIVRGGGVKYNGAYQSPQWDNYNPDKLQIGGTTGAVHAGIYTATFAPKEGCRWADGTTTEKSVLWTIEKAVEEIKTNVSSLDLSINKMSDIITVTWKGDGTIQAEAGNSNIVSTSVDGKKVTVTAHYSGETDITISVVGAMDYAPKQNAVIHVTAKLGSEILEQNSPEMIKKIAQSGQAANLWSVGDRIPIEIKGKVGLLNIDGTYYAFIIGFNHNSEIEGGNSIHFQFGKTANGNNIAFVDGDYGTYTSAGAFHMNNNGVSSGGWKDSYMRKTICPAFLAALPEDWQSVIVDCTKYSDNTGNGNNSASNVTATQDKIWLLAEFEVYGTYSIANTAEQNFQKQYDYYKNGNSKIKYKHNDTDKVCNWWMRSASATSNFDFARVNEDGSMAREGERYSCGFAPGFMVA